MKMLHTKFGYESPTEAKCDGELNKYFNDLNKQLKTAKEEHKRHERVKQLPQSKAKY